MIITDLGSYISGTKSILPWSVLREIGVEGACFKGAQEDIKRGVSTMLSLEQARAEGAKSCGCFYWDDPTVLVQVLLDSYSRAIDRERPDWISTDHEQYNDWSGNHIDPGYLSDHGQALAEGLQRRYPELRLLPYTGEWFVYGHAPNMAKWLPKFDTWFAYWKDNLQPRYRLTLEQIRAGYLRRTLYKAADGSYAYDMIQIQDHFGVTVPGGSGTCKLQQYSSRILLPYELVGGTIYDHQYDWDYAPMMIEEWIAYTKGETMPASIYNQLVSQKERAKVLTLEGYQKITVAPGELGIDAVILPMGSMHNWDGSHWKVKTESTFAGRFAQFAAANIPVLGRFDLDAGSLLAEQHTAPEFEGRAIRDNWILPYLLNAWHVGAWTWESVLGKQGKWRGVSAIIVRMTETAGYPAGAQVGGDWQKRIFDYVVYHLKYLMDNSMAPNVPIVLYTGMWWLNLYPQFMGVELQNDKTWLYLHLGQWLNASTATFNRLADIFAFGPADTFKFSSYPDGYFERILMHEFTGERQKVSCITDADGVPTPVNLSLWNDTPAAMRAALKFTPGTEPPPVDGEIAALKARIAELEKQVGEWVTWFNGAPV